MARKRLPMPATAKWSGICSGVSIICLSGWPGNMISIHWIEKRKPHRERLEDLIRRAGGGVSALNHGELQELGLLYRQTASDLSVVLEDESGGQLAAYLNQLLGRSHNLIYLGQRPKASGI